MSTTVNVLCYKSKVLANGESPLMLRICKDGKKKYKSIGVSINPIYWDYTKGKLKRNCPNYNSIHLLITEQLNEYSNQIVDFQVSKKDFTASSLVEKIDQPVRKVTVKAFIHALAALYLLNIYYRNTSWVVKYQEVPNLDYSMGSQIFAVRPPQSGELWYGNNPVISTSPYTVKYRDSDYQNIKNLQDQEQQALIDYMEKQPELHDSEFQSIMEDAIEREKKDPTQKTVLFWELTKYRLNKKIPSTLTFEERKTRLVNSEEWNGWIHQNNDHLLESELTEENIQKEIDKVGSRWGMELMKKIQRFEWLPIALNTALCEVSIL
jgi:hypothetical protein